MLFQPSAVDELGLLANTVAFQFGMVVYVVASDQADDAGCTSHLDVDVVVPKTRSVADVRVAPSSICAVGKRSKAFQEAGEA
jgi:hypothetical protein